MNLNKILDFDPLLGRSLDLFLKQIAFEFYDYIEDESQRKTHVFQDGQDFEKNKNYFTVHHDFNYYLNHLYVLEENNFNFNMYFCGLYWLIIHFVLR